MKTKLLSTLLIGCSLIVGLVVFTIPDTSSDAENDMAIANTDLQQNQKPSHAKESINSFFEIFSDQSKALPPPDLEINNVGGGYSTDIQNGVKTFLRCTTNQFASGFFEFEDPNQATYPPGTTFLIEWGQAGETDTTIPPTYRYFPGIYTLTYTVTFPNGTSESNTFRVFVGTEPPAPSITLSENDNCLPNEYEYTFSVNDNRPGNTYTISFNDGSAPRVINSEDYPFGAPINETFSHTFTDTSCGVTSTINGSPFANSYSISVTATNPCNTSGNFLSTGPIRVSEPTDADFIRPAEIACVNSLVNFTDISFGGENTTSAGCNSNYGRYWEIAPVGGTTIAGGQLGSDNGVPDDWFSWTDGSEVLGVVFDTPGVYNITLVTRNNCGESRITKEICIIPEVISEFTLSQDEACLDSNQIVSTDNTSQASGCGITPQYTWTVSQSNPDCPPTISPGWEFANGTGPNDEEPEFRFAAPGIYTIRLELFIEDILPGENCRDDVFERIITIKDRPKAELDDVIACEGEPFTIDPIIYDCYSDTPTTFSWDFGASPPASISNSTNPNPTISYTTTGNYTYELTVSNECGDRTFTGNIEIRPPSVVQADGPVDSCIDEDILLDGTISGGSGNGIWTASVPGGIFTPSDQTIDPTYTPPLGYNGTITFTFSSDNTGIFCSDASDTHSVLIESGARVNAGSDETICMDESIGLNGSFGGTATGITWTSSGGGTFIDPTNPNTTFTPPVGFVGTLTLTITTNTGAGLCPPISDFVELEVLPEGQVNPISDVTVCHLETQPEIQFASSNTLVTTRFDWSIDSNIGLAPLSGTGDLPSFQAQNLTDTPVTATVTVTPVVESGSTNCPGPPETFTITVNPSPSIQDDSLSLCNGGTFDYTPTNGGGNILPAGTTYTWATPVSNPVGAITGGSAEFTPQTSISQTVTNSTPNTATITYTITPTSSEGCQGDPFTLTINFDEEPVVQNIPVDRCSGDSFSIIPDAALAGNQIPAGTLYTWSAPTVTPAGGATGGTEQTTPVSSIDQQLTNTTDGVVTVVYSVTPTVNGCSGDPFDVELTLRPRPIVRDYDPVICSGDTFTVNPQNISPNSVPIGTRYTWSTPVVSNPGAISGASENTIPLNGISQTLINSSDEDVTVTYEVTPQSGSCSGDSFFINVVVEPTPFINNIQESVCTGGTFEVIPVTNGSDIVPTNTTYTWGTPISSPPGAVTGGSAETDPQTSISQNLTNTTEDIATLEYTVTPVSGNCIGTPFTLLVTLERAGDIEQEPEPLQSICVGGQPQPLNITLIDGQTSTTSIQWFENTNASTTGGTPISGATDTSYQPPVFDTPGIYFYYVVVEPLGTQCAPVTSQLSTIEVVPDPVINVQQMNNQELCLGATSNTLSVQASGGLGQLNYQWFVNDTADTTTGTPIANAVTNSYTPPTNQIGTNFYYVVISQNASGCEVTSNPARIRVEPQPVINQQPQAQEVCLGGASDLMSVNVNFSIGTPTYQWYENDENSNQGGTPIAGANQATYLPPTASEGEFYYYVIVNFSNSSCGPLRSDPARLNVVPLAELNPIDNIEVCTGDIIPRINFSTTAPSMLHTFSWTNSNPAIGLVANGVGNIPEFTAVNTSGVTQTATITVESQSIFGGDPCGNDVTEFTITVASEIVDNAVVSDYNGNQISCSGANDGSIQISPEGGVPISINQPYLFNWTGPNGFTSNQEDIFNLGPGTYELEITDNFGCVYNFSYEMEEPDELVVIDDSFSDILCHGELTGEILITVTGGTGDYSYQWLKDGFIFANTEDLLNIGAGIYTLIVTDENNCNPPRARQFEITQPTPIEIEVLDKSAIVCSDEIVIPGSGNVQNLVDEFDGFITIDVQGGTPFQSGSGELSYQYEWKNELDDVISTEKNLTGVGPGLYTVDVFDNLNCIASETVELIMPDPIEIEVDADDETCAFNQDGSIELDIEGGTPPYDVIWDSGQNGAIINNLAPGTYTAEITDRFNCKNTVSVDIEGVNPIEISASHENISCFGEVDGFIDIEVEGGRPIDIVSYEYSWTGPDGFTSTEPNLSNLEAGIYSLVVNDAIGCEKTVEVEIQEPEQLEVSFQTTQVNCFGVDDGTITLFVEGGTPPYTSNFGPGDSTFLFENLERGTYDIEVMDDNGCSVALEIEIDQEFINEIDPPTGEPFQEFCREDAPTVSDINVSGQGVRWYLSPMDEEALSDDFLITDDMILYARNFDLDLNCLSSDTFRVEVDIIDGILDVNNYITVNGNNLNDNLNVVNIELFPDNEMLIYNRYGKLVWETTGYNNTDNTFRGESNVGGTIGQSNSLPTGTYFYILNYRSPCNNDIKKGYVQIDNNNR
ncbi:PKD-like domain-containing protein [Psychroflexus tropicus]|uniref:PKD-like domain-containing protein n=1 Tax=Psychroflexus tropicus TaxID=197345 RepID=UPI0003828AF8|nr:PKD-like domain-containing protein [Psychroflexus tropicus]